jgi:hypothetical protein
MQKQVTTFVHYFCIFVLTNLNTVALSIISSIVLQKAQIDNIVHLVPPRNIIVAEAVTSSSAFLAKAAFASVVLVQLADS